MSTEWLLTRARHQKGQVQNVVQRKPAVTTKDLCHNPLWITVITTLALFRWTHAAFFTALLIIWVPGYRQRRDCSPLQADPEFVRSPIKQGGGGGARSRKIMRPGRDADNPPPSRAEVKNCGAILPFSPYASMVLLSLLLVRLNKEKDQRPPLWSSGQGSSLRIQWSRLESRRY
jgi:hypothetical protein